MKKEELERIIRELYELRQQEGTDEDVDFILGQVISIIGRE